MYQLTDQNLIILLLMIVWVLPWKGYALWTASRRDEKWWFIVLMIVNTFGILEIFYLFYVAKKKWFNIKNALNRLFSKK
ncbi:MAG: DUF5652 family protein [Candidatus Paceibacterota bacterium]|jgi:hypothetical protein